MIVYRNEPREECPKPRLREIASDLRGWMCSTARDHDAARDILIELGIVEAGVADALNPDVDTVSPTLNALRAASNSVGRTFVASWAGASADDQRTAVSEALRDIDALDGMDLPDSVRVGAPEGYSYYALYPEQYVAAATDVVRALRPRTAVCIGMRGIGTSLSAVVSATLERHGCTVSSYTVRPRGHPFDRQIRVAPALRQQWIARQDALFLVVDEGPGLSGSSFASVADALSSLGIPDARIVLLPSWSTDGSALSSQIARNRWQRHRNFVASFEDVLLRDNWLTRRFAPDASPIDFSAGKWRGHLLGNRSAWPAVQPSHERRKYLLRRDSQPALLLKFAGLGRAGRTKRERAERIAAAGFGPAPIDLQHGFFATELLDAEPLPVASPSASVLNRIADYVAFVAREFPDSGANSSGRDHQLCEMIELNTSEALGDSARHVVGRFLRAGAVPSERPVAPDGRMLPHEWLRCRGTLLLKTDAVDHHDDHFFPGSQDIAWDLAAASVEFNLSQSAEQYMVQRYGAIARDRYVAARMPFYRVAYLAQRVGYATLASQTLAASEDGARWLSLASAYRTKLASALTATYQTARYNAA